MLITTIIIIIIIAIKSDILHTVLPQIQSKICYFFKTLRLNCSVNLHSFQVSFLVRNRFRSLLYFNNKSILLKRTQLSHSALSSQQCFHIRKNNNFHKTKEIHLICRPLRLCILRNMKSQNNKLWMISSLKQDSNQWRKMNNNNMFCPEMLEN